MFVILVVFVIGNIATSAALSGVNLDCTNDYEYRMSCYFDALNCTDYNLTLWNLDGYGETHCLPVQCASKKCCCSIHMILILEEKHTAFLWRDGEYVEAKNISVKDSFKPQTPTIVSVNETNGNFEVIWRTNIEKNSIREIISTNLSYRKKGETQQVTKIVKAPQVEKPQCFLCFTTEILGARLEPNTTYVVTVQNILPWGSQASDHSEEYEFTTPASPESLFSTIIISLSLLAFTVTGAAYFCYVKCRAKYWDSVSNQKSKLLDILPSKEEVLKPVPPVISSIYVETLTPGDLKPWSKGPLIHSSTESLLHSSKFSSGPSSLSYACTEAADIIAGVQGALSKALMNIVPASLSTNQLLKESSKPAGVLSTCPSPCNSEQHSGLENSVMYSFIRPICPVQVTPDSQAQAEMPCQCAYQDRCGGSTCDDKLESAGDENMLSPTFVSSYKLTATAHRRASRDSGRFSNGEDSSFSGSNTSLSGDLDSKLEAIHGRCQMFSEACDKREDATKEGKHASLQGTILVNDHYQAIQGTKGLPNHPFEEQECKKQDPNEAFEHLLEDTPIGGLCFPPPSNHNFLVDDNYQAFKGLRALSHIQEQKTGKNQDLDKVFENVLMNATKSDNCIPSSKFSCLIDDNYQGFQGFRKVSGSHFEEEKSGKENLDKVTENSSEDAIKDHTCVNASSKCGVLVDDNYQVFRDSRELTDRHFGQQNSGTKNGLMKTLENSSEGVCIDDTCTPAKSNPSFPMNENYHSFNGLRKPSVNQVGERKRFEKENQGKDVENPFKDSVNGDEVYTCNHIKLQSSLPGDDNYQLCRGLRERPGSHFEKQNNENKSLEKSFENLSEDASKGNSCIDDNYQACQGFIKHTDIKFAGQRSTVTEEDWIKVLKNNLEDATKDNSYTPGSLKDSLPMEDNYKFVYSSSTQSDIKLAEHGVKKNDLISQPEMLGDSSVHQRPFFPTDLKNQMIIESGYEMI